MAERVLDLNKLRRPPVNLAKRFSVEMVAALAAAAAALHEARFGEDAQVLGYGRLAHPERALQLFDRVIGLESNSSRARRVGSATARKASELAETPLTGRVE